MRPRAYGTPSHLTMEYLRMLANFPATPVTYRGLSPLIVDLLSGQVKVGFVATAGVHRARAGGKAQGAGGIERKTIPAHEGRADRRRVRISRYSTSTATSCWWRPRAFRSRLHAKLESEVRRAVTQAAFRRNFNRVTSSESVPPERTPRSWIANDLPRWEKVIKAAKMQVN